MPPGTVIGHVHLHVGNLAAASDLFSEALGFDATVWDYPGALFFAASGYRHHLGANTWAGREAQPPTDCPHCRATVLRMTVTDRSRIVVRCM